MLHRLRKSAFAALSSTVGDRLLPVRLGKKAALLVNDLVGRPLADQAELERRAEFERRRSAGEKQARVDDIPEAVPAVLWHQGDQRDAITLRKILDEAGIAYDVRDVDGDLPTVEALHREGGGRPLPLLFVAGTCIGGVEAVRRLVATGELAQLVAARTPPAERDAKVGALGDPAVAAQIYGTETCPWTGRARALLEREGIEHRFIDLDSREGLPFADRLTPETRHNTQPWVFLRGEFVGGFNALDEIARLGQLDERTRAASADDPRGRTKIVVAERDNTDEIAPARSIEP